MWSTTGSVGRGRVLLWSTIGFAVLYGAAYATLGTPPDAHDSGAVVADWFRSHGGHVRAWLFLGTLALVLFVVYAALVRSRLPEVHRDLFFAGAVLLVAESSVQGWLWAGMAGHASSLSPATARTLLDVASYWGPVLTSATVLMLAPVTIVAFSADGALPRWLGWVTGVALVEQLAETVTMLGRSGFIAPGGPMNVVLGGAFTSVALIATGVVVARAMRDEPLA
jgi:hypothetical protein